jgi:predicted nuclease of predicted toxin-antitoxin system
MPRFLIDEDLPHLLAKLLTERGHPSEHVRDLNLRGSPDSRVFEVAQQREAVLVTGDADFGNLLRYPLATHLGIVVVQFPSAMRTRELAAQIAITLSALEDVSFEHTLVVIEPGRLRFRRPV